jgi:hypothetical protein
MDTAMLRRNIPGGVLRTSSRDRRLRRPDFFLRFAGTTARRNRHARVNAEQRLHIRLSLLPDANSPPALPVKTQGVAKLNRAASGAALFND